MLQESTRNLLLDRLDEKTKEKKGIQAKLESGEIYYEQYQEYHGFEITMLEREIETIRETIIHDEIQ